MAASRKVQVISTKYFMCINWGHYVIYLQNIKFMRLILWPGGAYTNDAYATKPESWSHIRIHFMNHDYIGSFWQCQMSQKRKTTCNPCIFFILQSHWSCRNRRTSVTYRDNNEAWVMGISLRLHDRLQRWKCNYSSVFKAFCKGKIVYSNIS